MKNLLVSVMCGVLCAQMPFLPAVASVNWLTTFEPSKRFIENRTQFDGKDGQPGSSVLYGVDWGAAQIYFTRTGLTYRFEKGRFGAEEERGGDRKFTAGKSPADSETETDLVQLQWLNANSDAVLLALDETEDYFSYTIVKGGEAKNINHIRAYKKLLYKELYPNIDVEYAFHTAWGVKYKIILHPGADVSQVKMRFKRANDSIVSGDGIFLDQDGNLHIRTILGDIIDYAPITAYQAADNSVIPSEFILSGNEVSFSLKNYNSTQTVIIDPWTVTPNLPNVNKVYYIKADTSGSAYIYGGDTPYRLQKYNSAGALQWTYNTPWSAANEWFGGLEVDPAGNSYLTSGTGVAISKVNTAGGLVWSNSPGNFYEYWDPAFNCDYTQLIVGGTLLTDVFTFKFYGAAFRINLSNGALDSTVIVA
ncbi:MAG TPA: hypothetical protein VNJ07_14065, partial [Chitinophagales bacterium]|nr:hypothetical protein [Chitinophagales bacterium]